MAPHWYQRYTLLERSGKPKERSLLDINEEGRPSSPQKSLEFPSTGGSLKKDGRHTGRELFFPSDIHEYNHIRDLTETVTENTV